MKRTTQVLGIALVAAVALLLPMQAQATCGSDISFGSYYSFVTNTGGDTTVSPTLRANFWALGSGNPALGAGNDNGPIVEGTNWLVQYGGGLAVLSGWAARTYDGCPDSAEPVFANQRMVLAFSDNDGAGNMTYAVACAGRNPQAGTQFDFTRPGNAPLALVPAQKAGISNTVRVGNEATVTIAPPNFGPGFYTDGSTGCTLANVIPQFDVYKQQTARNAPAPTDNNAGGGWVLATTCTFGGPACTVTTNCGATNCDNYLAVVPHYNSNFTTAEAATSSPARVSASSTKVAAGPILAVTPKPKPIPNPRVEAPRPQQHQ